MSSERSGGKPDSEEAGPASAGTSARLAALWGPARNALAAVHNLDALLRSSHVSDPTIHELLSELRSSGGVLSDAFARAQGADPAATAVGQHGAERVAELGALLDAIGAATGRRQDLASRAGPLADGLEACVDLLALLDRAAAPLSTDVRLDLLAREAGRMASSARGRELTIRFDGPSPNIVVATDPTVLRHLVSLLVASKHAASPDTPLVLRARSTPKAHLLVEAARASDAALPIVLIRVMPWLPPSEPAARRAAARLGALFEVGAGRASLALGPACD